MKAEFILCKTFQPSKPHRRSHGYPVLYRLWRYTTSIYRRNCEVRLLQDDEQECVVPVSFVSETNMSSDQLLSKTTISTTNNFPSLLREKLTSKTQALTADVVQDSKQRTEKPCPDCGKEELTFSQVQTRGADEGSTIFYFCLNCGHRYLYPAYVRLCLLRCTSADRKRITRHERVKSGRCRDPTAHTIICPTCMNKTSVNKS